MRKEREEWEEWEEEESRGVDGRWEGGRRGRGGCEWMQGEG